MDDNKIVAAILTAPILSNLGDDSSDIPPEVAVSVYEEVLSALQRRDKIENK